MLEFRYALTEWEDRNLETREGYWARRSGKRFGEELRRLFLARGCGVEVLECDDDLRIDLIVSAGGVRLYCVCDGRFDGVAAGTLETAIELAAARGCRPVVFHRDCQWTGPALARARGVALLSPAQIAESVGADSLHIPIKRRSALGRLLHIWEKPEILASWPSPADDTQSTQSSPISR